MNMQEYGSRFLEVVKHNNHPIMKEANCYYCRIL